MTRKLLNFLNVIEKLTSVSKQGYLDASLAKAWVYQGHLPYIWILWTFCPTIKRNFQNVFAMYCSWGKETVESFTSLHNWYTFQYYTKEQNKSFELLFEVQGMPITALPTIEINIHGLTGWQSSCHHYRFRGVSSPLFLLGVYLLYTKLCTCRFS